MVLQFKESAFRYEVTNEHICLKPIKQLIIEVVYLIIITRMRKTFE